MALEDTIQRVCNNCIHFGHCNYVRNVVQINRFLVDQMTSNPAPF